MSVTAFAAGGATGTHTLTVNVKSTTPAQDLKGQTINLYKLFDDRVWYNRIKELCIYSEY